MKILVIRGKNLASLEGEFEVDFTVEPLVSAGIFAITGSTGSGKSTLLDTICLALFNDTPRINRAVDNADIKDVKSLTIKQKDSRSILRRGTIDGYAEVEFVSLSGDVIRATWSVRRSRNKIDGSLQNVTYRVFNLTSGSELQGGKSELLIKVRELIGLTFDQFTRAVLLAQGDFATFLKANKNEKAELLEKLTGTDIYSRISVEIYENTKKAEENLALIMERIKSVETINTEQIVELVYEKEILDIDIPTLESGVNSLSKNIEWLRVDEQLITTLVNVQNELLKSHVDIEQAKSRFDYMERVDSVQQIRDDFKQFSNDKKQLSEHHISLQVQQEQSSIDLLALAGVRDILTEYKKQHYLLNEQWQGVESQIKEARRLDTLIGSVVKNIDEVEKELTQFVEHKLICDKGISTIEKEVNIIAKSQKEISNWFEINEIHSGIVMKIEFLSTYISELYYLQDSVVQKEKEIEILKQLLCVEQRQLEDQKEEAVRLNEMLPAEVLSLRAKLVDDKPCPVCGSTLHPITSITNVDTLEEESLNRAKEIISSTIDSLMQNISNKKEQLILSSSFIINYNNQYEKLLAKVAESLGSIPQWQVKYGNKTLDAELKSIATQWEHNIKEQLHLKDSFNEQHQNLKVTLDRCAELAKVIDIKKGQQTIIIDELSKLILARKEVLSGKDADSVEEQMRSEIDVNNECIIDVVTQRDLLIAKCEKLAGIIVEIETRITVLTITVLRLENSVSSWLLSRKDNLNFEQLSELLSKDNSWLISERNFLNTLTKNEHSLQATLDERQRVINEHYKSDVKPTQEQTKEDLTLLFELKRCEFTKKCERRTEIGVLFTNHEKGKERIKKFEREINEKMLTAENWRKLNELFGSADGAKFKVLAQGYTLDVLLGYANRHLKEVSQRYVLERASTDSLALQVVDLDMLSEVRSVHSLSGGESFLISLSLALGLSSLSSNRMSVESLFIDEGFGTLDAETLRVAMDALERLQTQGRKIGVISHVTEMTERIMTQVRVTSHANGKSHIEIESAGKL